MPGVNIKVKFNAEGADSAEKATKTVGDALDKVADSAGGMAASVESAWAALKSRATADIAAEMKRVVEAFRDIKSAGTSSAQDVSRASSEVL